MTKSKRSGKVFLDWSPERRFEDHAVAVLAARTRAARRSPRRVTWDEVEAGAEDPLGLEQFRYEEVLERLEDGR